MLEGRSPASHEQGGSKSGGFKAAAAVLPRLGIDGALPVTPREPPSPVDRNRQDLVPDYRNLTPEFALPQLSPVRVRSLRQEQVSDSTLSLLPPKPVLVGVIPGGIDCVRRRAEPATVGNSRRWTHAATR